MEDLAKFVQSTLSIINYMTYNERFQDLVKEVQPIITQILNINRKTNISSYFQSQNVQWTSLNRICNLTVSETQSVQTTIQQCYARKEQLTVRLVELQQKLDNAVTRYEQLEQQKEHFEGIEANLQEILQQKTDLLHSFEEQQSAKKQRHQATIKELEREISTKKNGEPENLAAKQKLKDTETALAEQQKYQNSFLEGMATSIHQKLLKIEDLQLKLKKIQEDFAVVEKRETTKIQDLTNDLQDAQKFSNSQRDKLQSVYEMLSEYQFTVSRSSGEVVLTRAMEDVEEKKRQEQKQLKSMSENLRERMQDANEDLAQAQQSQQKQKQGVNELQFKMDQTKKELKREIENRIDRAVFEAQNVIFDKQIEEQTFVNKDQADQITQTMQKINYLQEQSKQLKMLKIVNHENDELKANQVQLKSLVKALKQAAVYEHDQQVEKAQHTIEKRATQTISQTRPQTEAGITRTRPMTEGSTRRPAILQIGTTRK